MNKAVTIARRELLSYFYSPIAYATLTLFLLVTGILFALDFVPGKPVGMYNMFNWLDMLLAFILPILCMGLLAQEWATGTIESMMTAPVTDTQLVLGKFMAAMVFFVLLLAPTLVYVILLRIYASPDMGPIFSAYLGAFLLGALFISVGLFCSSLTKMQLVAAVGCIAILFPIAILPHLVVLLGTFVSLPWFCTAMLKFSIYRSYADFTTGVIDTGNLVILIAFTVVTLFITVKLMEWRRWR